MKIRLLCTATTAAVIVPLLALGASASTSPAGEPGAERADAGASSRHPSVRRVHDARGDVLRVTERRGDDVFTPAPARRHGDIASFRIAHRDAVVVATVKLRALTPSDRFFGAVLQLRTGRATFTAVIYRLQVGAPLETQFDGGGKHSCAGLRHRVDYSRDTMWISVPRTCLANPESVRSRAVIDYFGRPATGDAFFADAVPGSTLPRVPFLPRAWEPSREGS